LYFLLLRILFLSFVHWNLHISHGAYGAPSGFFTSWLLAMCDAGLHGRYMSTSCIHALTCLTIWAHNVWWVKDIGVLGVVLAHPYWLDIICCSLELSHRVALAIIIGCGARLSSFLSIVSFLFFSLNKLFFFTLNKTNETCLNRTHLILNFSCAHLP